MLPDYPYTNFHELNLDWVLQCIKELEARVKALEAQAETTTEEGESADA